MPQEYKRLLRARNIPTGTLNSEERRSGRKETSAVRTFLTSQVEFPSETLWVRKGGIEVPLPSSLCRGWIEAKPAA